MNIESIWMIIVAISTPVAGIVAFYIQLKNVKQVNLENEKLKLEVRRLKDENEVLERRIRPPTDDEIKKYSKKEPAIMFSKTVMGGEELPVRNFLLRIDWGSLLLATLMVGFISYFFYDIYRFGSWLINLF